MRYLESANDLRADQLRSGFFEGWPNPPDPDTHLRLLRQSDRIALALDEQSDTVIGFATALTDGVLAAFVSFLEVLPAWRGRGVGTALIQRLVASIEPIYGIDVICDPELQPFYERAGPFRPGTAMISRSYAHQSGQAGAASGD
ncbi:MAG: GNAT family N-acetyltransferase [Chloroflexi bacterium]|nr:GNAT family N-acetyltransferase [Chloroflexota bacterium]